MLLHHLCVSVERYCYLRVYDFHLHALMRYKVEGMTWGPPDAAEQHQYRSAKNLTLKQNELLSGYGASLIRKLSGAPYSDVGLVHVKATGPLRFSGRKFLPVFPGELKTRHAAHGLLDRCFVRFVTEPQSAPPPTRAVVTYQFRTGFADIPSETLRRLHRTLLVQAERKAGKADRVYGGGGGPGVVGERGSDHSGIDGSTMDAWLRLACPATSYTRELAGAHVLTDSPVLAAHLTSRDAFARLRAGDAAAWHAWHRNQTIDLLGRGPTRSWSTSLATRQAAFADMVLGSQSRLAYLGASSFGRPLVARSVCLEHVHVDLMDPHINDRMLPDPNTTSACPYATPLFHRGLFESLMTANGRLTWHSSNPRGLRKHNRTMGTMEWWHPCKRLSPSLCAATWLASVTGTSVNAAARAIAH